MTPHVVRLRLSDSCARFHVRLWSKLEGISRRSRVWRRKRPPFQPTELHPGPKQDDENFSFEKLLWEMTAEVVNLGDDRGNTSLSTLKTSPDDVIRLIGSSEGEQKLFFLNILKCQKVKQ